MTNKEFAIWLTIVIATVIQHCPAFAESGKTGRSPDLAAHPLYSKYEFGKKENVIDFATQPLAAPVGVIAEVMQRDKILKKALSGKGAEVRFHPFLKGSDINYFLKRGDIDFAMAGDLPTIMLASGFDISIVGLAKQGASSLVSKKRLLPEEFRGKRIGYPEGSSAHYGLLIALASAGLKESDVKLVPMEINKLAGALARDEVDAFSAWEPTPSAALAKHKEFVVIQKFINSSYLFEGRTFAERYPEETSHIVASFVRALRWMKKDEKNLVRAAEWTMEAGKILQGGPQEASVEQIAAVTKTDILQITSNPVIPQSDFMQDGPMHKAFEFLKGQGKVPSSAVWEKVHNSLDRGVMDSVLSNPSKYRLNSFEYDGAKGKK